MSTSTFTLAHLPKWELKLCWIVWIFHSLAAFFIAFLVSRGPTSDWTRHWMSPSEYVEGVGRDDSDPEWKVFRGGIIWMILSHIIHSISFHISLRLFHGTSLKIVLITFGLSCQSLMTSIRCMIILLTFCFIVTSLTCIVRSRVVAFTLCILFIVKAPDYLPFSMSSTHAFYREFNVYLYGAIKVLNFCLYLCKNPGTSYKGLFLDHLVYFSYLPYSMSLIVLYEDFQTQIHKRILNKYEWNMRHILWFGCRMILWFFVYELLLHLVYVNSLFNSPYTVINGLNNYELSAIAYVSGQLFHLKYVIIFGLPSFFAYLDGMIPPPPPICISRVSKYSRMWRHFDHGLHQFLKHQVYVPLMKPPLPFYLSVLRGLATLVAVFSVVIAWHGARPHYICWVTLSAFELIIERIGHYLWSLDLIQNFNIKVGGVWMRRVVAVSMLATVIPGIFGVFFFLGQEGIGNVIFNKVLVQGFQDILTFNVYFDRWNSGLVLSHLLVLGYFFNHVCLQLDHKKTVKKD